MKVLHIVNDLIRGGTEGQCARVVMGLARRGRDEHRVVVFRRQGFFFEQVEAVCGTVYEIKVRHLVRWQTVRAVLNLKTWMREEAFDVVHTWDAESAIFGGMSAVLAGIPLITSRRDLGAIYPRWKRVVLNWMDRHAAQVVVNARAIGRQLVEQGGDAGKIRTIPNVIDLAEFDALARRTVENMPPRATADVAGEKNAESLRVVCVSRMDPEKDHETLLKAFARCTADAASRAAELFLVGDGVERGRLEALADELGLGGRVHFMGEQHDVPAILSRMDAGVLIPKSNEGLSNSILEYMAAGLPVICSDCGGNTELVSAGENGWVVPVSDEKAVSSALEKLRDAQTRKKMGAKGRKRLEEGFSMQFVLEDFEALYHGLQISHTNR